MGKTHENYVLKFLGSNFLIRIGYSKVLILFLFAGHFLFQVILLLLACIHLGMGIEQRLNYGIVFVDKGDLTVSSEQWEHTFMVNVQRPKVNISFALNCENCDFLRKMYPLVAEIYHTAMNDISDIITHVDNIIPEHKFSKQTRSKRTLLPFVGSIGKTLFGFAVTNDVERIAKHVNTVINKTNYLSNAFVKTNAMLTSFMQSTDDRLSNMFKTMQWNHELLKNLSVQLNETNQLNLQQSTIQVAFMKMRLYTERLKASYNKLLAACNELIEGKLPESLIPYKVLAATISNISKEVKLHRYRLFSKDPLFYYKYGNFKFFRHSNNLYITVMFPIMVENNHLSLYKILTYPVPINATSTHASKIADLPTFLAIAKNKQYYVELDSTTLGNCKTFHNKILCSNTISLTPIDYKQCSISLLEGHKTNIHTYCNFHFIPNAFTPSLRQLNETHFMLFNTSTLILNCPLQTKQIPGCQFCLITIPCNCSITSENAYIPERLTRCHHHSVPVTKLYPVNLAMLQQFFSTDILADIEAHSTFTDTLNVTLPKFNIFNHNYSNIIAKENYEHLNLKKMIDIAKKNNIIYTSLAEPLLQSQFTASEKFPIEILLASISIVIALLALIGLIAMVLKFKRFSLLYASALLTTTAHASLPSFIYTTTTETQVQVDTSDSLYDITAFHIFIFILGIVIIYKCIRICLKKTEGNLLIIEVTNGSQCVQIPLMFLPLCLQQCQFTGTCNNVLNGLTVNCKLYPSISVDYGDLKIKDKLSQRELPLPKTVTIGPFQAFKLKRILKAKFVMCLWVKHSQISTPVQIVNNSGQDTLQVIQPSVGPETSPLV